MEMRGCSMSKGVKATILMVMVQVVTAGVNVLYKLASNDGMSVRIMIAYRFVFSAATILPLALFFERNRRPKFTWMVLVDAFISALFGGTIFQNLYAETIVLISATFAATSLNLVPALTFLVAVLFGLEKFDLKTKPGMAKVVGTLICISGAMILVYYRGAQIKLWSIHSLLLHKHGGELPKSASHLQTSDHILGSFFGIACALSSAIGWIFRARLSERYPCHYSSTFLICLMSCLQALVFALCMENKHWHRWKMGWNIRLLTVAYSGIMSSGVTLVMIMWCVKLRGPLFVSIFSPLTLVLVAFAGTLFLEEKIYVGSVLGALVVVCGLYSVIWGNAREVKGSPQKSDDRDRQFETTKISGEKEEEECKNCSLMMAIEIAPNLAAVPEVDTSDPKEEDEVDDHQYLEAGQPIIPRSRA